ANSDAWVITALVAAGEDPLSEQWAVPAGNTMVDHLASLQNEDGSFGDFAQIPTTADALIAFASIGWEVDETLWPPSTLPPDPDGDDDDDVDDDGGGDDDAGNDSGNGG